MVAGTILLAPLLPSISSFPSSLLAIPLSLSLSSQSFREERTFTFPLYKETRLWDARNRRAFGRTRKSRFVEYRNNGGRGK